MKRLFKYCVGISALCLSFSLMPTTMVHANSTEVDIVVEASSIDLSVPISIQCTLNPNGETEEEKFIHGDLYVTNNSLAPIRVSVSDIIDTNNTFEEIVTADGLPAGKTWEELSVADSDKYFALSTNASSGWSTVSNNSDIEMATLDAVTPIGTLVSKAKGELDLKAKFGLSQSSAKEFQFSMILIGDLEEDITISETAQEYLAYQVISTYDGPLEYEGVNVKGEVTINSLSDEGVTQNLSVLSIPETVTIGEEYYLVTGVADNAFDSTQKAGVENIGILRLPNTLKTIGHGAFAEMHNISDIIIPASVTDIANYAFIHCTSVNTVKIMGEDASSINIGYQAFGDLADGSVIYVKDSDMPYGKYLVDVTDKSVFLPLNTDKKIIQTWEAGANVAATLYYENGHHYLTFTGTGDMYDVDNNYVNNSQSGILVYPQWRDVLNEYEDITCTFGEGITYIGNRCLLACETVNSVSLPSTVDVIGEEAFRGTVLEDVYLNEGLKEIKQGAFMLNYFPYVNFPSTLESIETLAFSYCRRLNSVTIPEGLVNIEGSAFTDCADLRFVKVFGESKSFGSRVFYGIHSNPIVVTDNETVKQFFMDNADDEFIPSTASVKLSSECSPWFETANKSVWVWNSSIVSNYSELINFINTYGITEVYQTFDSEMLSNTENHAATNAYVTAINGAGADVWAMTGAADNAYKWTENGKIMHDIYWYNNNGNAAIRGLVIDDEVHCTAKFEQNAVEALNEYILNIRQLDYISSHLGIPFRSTVGAGLLDDYSVSSIMFRDLTDGVNVMNYFEEGYIDSLSKEVKEATKHNRHIESVIEIVPDGSGAGNCTNMDTAIARNKEIAESYKYDGLGFSYHYFPKCVE